MKLREIEIIEYADAYEQVFLNDEEDDPVVFICCYPKKNSNGELTCPSNKK
jgi:hypothetical protein